MQLMFMFDAYICPIFAFYLFSFCGLHIPAARMVATQRPTVHHVNIFVGSKVIFTNQLQILAPKNLVISQFHLKFI